MTVPKPLSDAGAQPPRSIVTCYQDHTGDGAGTARPATPDPQPLGKGPRHPRPALNPGHPEPPVPATARPAAEGLRTVQ